MDVSSTILLLVAFLTSHCRAAAAGGWVSSPTPKSLDVYASTGFTPKPTTIAVPGKHQGLKGRDGGLSASVDTCGWVSNTLHACDNGIWYSECLWNRQNHVIGCCLDSGDCTFYTTCIPYSASPATCPNGDCQSGNVLTTFCDSNSPNCGTAIWSSGADQYSQFSCGAAEKVDALTLDYLGVTYVDLPRFYDEFYGLDITGSTAVGSAGGSSQTTASSVTPGLTGPSSNTPYSSGTSSTTTPTKSTTSTTTPTNSATSTSVGTTVSEYVSQHIPLIAGIAAAAVFLAIAGCCIYCCCRRSRRTKPQLAEPDSSHAYYQSPQ